MQSVWRMVFTRIFLSEFFAATSSGARGLAMRLSEVLRTGTLRCISTLAAAEEAMGFAGFNVSDGAPAKVGRPPRGLSVPFVRVPLAPGSGMVIFSSHEGHSISEPAPAASTSSSCSQFGQLKIMSIKTGVVVTAYLE